MSRVRLRLFLIAWIAFSFFHQGGGDASNAHFALVRAIVEEGTFALDSYLFYSGIDGDESEPVLRRNSVRGGGFEQGGRRFVAEWPGGAPVREPVGDEETAALARFAASLDVDYVGGSFYSELAPGTAFLAVPAYFAIHRVERMLGMDPDDWWLLTVNAWLTRCASVGLIGAAGVVLLFSLACALEPESPRAALWAAVLLGFGSVYFPYATMLYGHVPAAVALLAAWAALAGPTPRPLVGGGLLGASCLFSYAVALPAAGLGLWALIRSPARLRVAVGAVVSLLPLAFYRQLCFGSPLPPGMEGGLDRDPAEIFEAFVGVTVSPFRGLFFSSPGLLLGLAGLAAWAACRRRRPSSVALLALTAGGVAANVLFRDWHGGWGFGPRFLIPVIPFLALPATTALRRFPRAGGALVALSATTVFLATAVDPQTPLGARLADRPGRPALLREPLSEYVVPVFSTGTAAPILDALVEAQLRRMRAFGEAEGFSAEEIEQELEWARGRAARRREQGAEDFPLTLFRGPVSAHPVGVYERRPAHLFRPPHPVPSWNAFNAGELLLPQRRASLLFLLLLLAPPGASLWTATRSRPR